MQFRIIYLFFLAGFCRLDKYFPVPFWVKILWAPVIWMPYRGNANLACLFFESAGPAFIKLGQFLSLRDDILPADLVEQLEQLQDACSPVKSSEIIKNIEDSFQAPIQEIFPDFDPQPIATASLAQVHNIGLSKGKPMVAKVLKPNILEAIERDLSLMEYILRAVSARFPHIPLLSLFEQYRSRTLGECDLRQEAARTEKMRKNSLANGYIEFAQVDWDQSNGTVIVMTKLDAIRLNEIQYLDASEIDVKQLALNGTRAFFKQVLVDNFFHGDMHHGNIMVKRGATAQFCSVDCAVSGSLEQSEINLFAEILWLLCEKEYASLARLLHHCGWIDASVHWSETEISIMSYFEPIADKPIGELNLARIITDLTRQIHRYGFVLQPNFALLVKTLSQIESLGRKLYPMLDFWQVVREEISKWRHVNHQKNIVKSQLDQHLLLAKVIGPEVIAQKVMDNFKADNLASGRVGSSHQSETSARASTKHSTATLLVSYSLLVAWFILVWVTQFHPEAKIGFLTHALENDDIVKIILVLWGITLASFRLIGHKNDKSS